VLCFSAPTTRPILLAPGMVGGGEAGADATVRSVVRL
jgi:hypothetical protein